MGLTWSTRHDFYVHQFSNPRVQTFAKEMIIDVHKCNNANPFINIVDNQCIDQKAVLVSIKLKTMINGYQDGVSVFLSDVYPDQERPLQITCPSQFEAVIPDIDSTVYKHELAQDKIEMYAGLDRTILKDKNPSENSDYECFPHNHPIVEFIKLHGTLLQPEDGDFVKKEGETKTYYLVKNTFISKVRDFFSNHIFNKMKYSRFENARVVCELPAVEEKQTLLIVLMVTYVLINPGTGELIHTEERLK